MRRALKLLGIGARRFARGRMRKHMLLPSPFEQFRLWMEEAKKRSHMVNPNACCLCTADGSGRMVLLKGADTAGFVFYTNYQSEKGRVLARRRECELVFYWDSMGRQARVWGGVVRTTPAESDAYFASRPRESRIAAWASLQSREAESLAAMEKRYAQFEEKFRGGEVPRPPHWGGFRLKPLRIEFWQADPFRFHDRFRYTFKKGRWELARVYP